MIGVLSCGAELLLIRRADGVAKPGRWCFPGGHVEPDESPRQAIRRELVEELGIEVEPTERLGSVRLPEAGYVLAVWRVRHLAGQLQPCAAEIAAIRWATPAQIRAFSDGLPSNLDVLGMLAC